MAAEKIVEMTACPGVSSEGEEELNQANQTLCPFSLEEEADVVVVAAAVYLRFAVHFSCHDLH